VLRAGRWRPRRCRAACRSPAASRCSWRRRHNPDGVVALAEALAVLDRPAPRSGCSPSWPTRPSTRCSPRWRRWSTRSSARRPASRAALRQPSSPAVSASAGRGAAPPADGRRLRGARSARRGGAGEKPGRTPGFGPGGRFALPARRPRRPARGRGGERWSILARDPRPGRHRLWPRLLSLIVRLLFWLLFLVARPSSPSSWANLIARTWSPTCCRKSDLSRYGSPC